MFWMKMSDRRVLAVQVRASAGLHRGGDLLHALVAGRERQQRAGGERAVENCTGGTHQRDDYAVVTEKASQLGTPPRSSCADVAHLKRENRAALAPTR
jgi:hypothetical protein